MKRAWNNVKKGTVHINFNTFLLGYPWLLLKYVMGALTLMSVVLWYCDSETITSCNHKRLNRWTVTLFHWLEIVLTMFMFKIKYFIYEYFSGACVFVEGLVCCAETTKYPRVSISNSLYAILEWLKTKSVRYGSTKYFNQMQYIQIQKWSFETHRHI